MEEQNLLGSAVGEDTSASSYFEDLTLCCNVAYALCVRSCSSS
jgi:hypothetical protein